MRERGWTRAIAPIAPDSRTCSRARTEKAGDRSCTAHAGRLQPHPAQRPSRRSSPSLLQRHLRIYGTARRVFAPFRRGPVRSPALRRDGSNAANLRPELLWRHPAVRRQRAPDFVPKLVPALEAVGRLRDRDDLPRRYRQQATLDLVSQAVPIERTVLNPSDRSAVARWTKVIRAKHIFRENPERAVVRAEHIVHEQERSRNEIGLEELDVGLRAFVGMIAVDPEETNRLVPFARELRRFHHPCVDVISEPGAIHVRAKLIERRCLALEIRIGDARSRMWIDGDDDTELVPLADVSKADRRSPLEASDLHVDAFSRD